jgi:hypothetical protein
MRCSSQHAHHKRRKTRGKRMLLVHELRALTSDFFHVPQMFEYQEPSHQLARLQSSSINSHQMTIVLLPKSVISVITSSSAHSLSPSIVPDITRTGSIDTIRSLPKTITATFVVASVHVADCDARSDNIVAANLTVSAVKPFILHSDTCTRLLPICHGSRLR